MYENPPILIMGEAKRRKNLGIPLREQNKDIELPQIDKKLYNKKLGLNCINIQLSLFFFMELQ